ncbi:MAG: hypothetical protein Kow00108_02830 [Calditrichia bacterium]
MNLKAFFVIVMMIFFIQCSDSATGQDGEQQTVLSPAEMVKAITRGINVGNTLEPPLEGEWNNGPMQEYYFDDIKEAGFTVVRIPVRWDKHTDSLPPYQVDDSWMDRVEQVVDWALERQLYVILNAHHEWWLVQDFNSEKKRRFESIWNQISERFQSKSLSLMFEVINEPKGLTQSQLDSINADVLRIIREKNPNRIVIIGGHEWANAEQLVTMAVPEDDFLMAYYHSYDPWTFAGEGKGLWGTLADLEAMKNRFDLVKSWSVTHATPVILSEFGAITECDYNSRMRYYYYAVRSALEREIPFMVWDDGGMFGLYDRENRTWSEVKDILIYTFPDSPDSLYATTTIQPAVNLSWKNGSKQYQRIFIERKSQNENSFSTIAQLDGNVASWQDTNVQRKQAYIYRIIAEEDTKRTFSYPLHILVP